MFQAIGRGALKNDDGTVTVRAEILDDRTGATVGTRSYTGTTVTSIRALILTDLNKLKASEQDAALNQAVVGVVLGIV